MYFSLFGPYRLLCTGPGNDFLPCYDQWNNESSIGKRLMHERNHGGLFDCRSFQPSSWRHSTIGDAADNDGYSRCISARRKEEVERCPLGFERSTDGTCKRTVVAEPTPRVSSSRPAAHRQKASPRT